ncbi:hypothetical protein [Microbacterium saperdae]|uniref:Uncharacterized protein n=1 Tax=Microbacterium saperdae TaxID=69368 RepID=A0A543BI65_9MICO|nr:hypothetical protein [Microbacterium saperdae]TQL84494.1 hypothetical protein FB560_0081 [Microbacterium saperdae]GGM60737.1 hypothetical protein GCM10010489_35360 [Microbacterium saperdae]
MNTFIATKTSHLGPIDPDWTIADLIQWLSDDARQHEAALRHPLARIEALITGVHWAGTPSTIALIRSLVEALRQDPALRGMRIRELGPQHAPETPERIPQLA